VSASMIRNPDLASQGEMKIEWVKPRMPVLNHLISEMKIQQPFAGHRIAMCLHLEAKTAYLAMVLSELGGEVVVAGSNPLSTQDDVAAALSRTGVTVFAWHGATAEEYAHFIERVVLTGPHLLIDDGGDLVSALHSHHEQQRDMVLGGAEETTTGLIRLRAMARDGVLAFPMMAVNDARCKHLFDNRHGTGQSVWDGILRTTNLVVAGKVVVVAGYGWCGRGIAQRAQGLGARVIVTEIDPVAANEALMDGHAVMPMREAAAEGDLFITATGCRDVITAEHFGLMKDGAILCNAGHFNVEVDVAGLRRAAVSCRQARVNIQEYALPSGRKLHLLGEGRLVNLACGDGHPAEIMDLSFALQVLALDHVRRNASELKPGVHSLGRELDERVARLRLEALGLSIDQLSPAQRDYLDSWNVN